MNLETILEKIGAFGRYQKLMTVAIGLISSFSAMTVYVTVFTLARPELICKSTIDTGNATAPDSCQIWKSSSNSILNSSTEYACHFDQTYYGESIITEWGLVCDKLYLASLAQTILMLGASCAVFFGVFSDKYGRRFVCLVSSIALSVILVIGEILQLSTFKFTNQSKYVIFTTGQFLVGLTGYVLYVNAYVLIVEMTSSRYSLILSNASLFFYVFGELITLLVAYLLRDWHLIMWFMAGFSILISGLIFFVPESPKFLVAQKKFDEAEKVFAKISKFNHREIVSFDSEVLEKLNAESDPNASATSSKTDLDSIKNAKSVIQIFAVSYIWIAINMLYFGVSLGFTSIGTIDPYLAYLLSSVSEIIGYTLCTLNGKFGTKRMFNIFLVLASVICISVSMLPKPTQTEPRIGWKSILIMSFACVGKVMASGSFNSTMFFTSQFFPTRIRGTLVLFVSCVGRIGSLISPQINLLGAIVWGPLPYLVFGVSSLIASVLLFLLPQTASVN